MYIPEKLRIPIDTDSYKTTEEESETSEDLKGDLQVDALTNESLKSLKYLKNNSWAQVEVVSDIEIEIEDEEEENGEEDENDEDSINEIAPLLICAK
jgi:hypothetical protein